MNPDVQKAADDANRRQRKPEIAAGRVRVGPDGPGRPDAILRTDPKTLLAMLGDPGAFDAAIFAGRAEIEGDPQVPRLLLRDAAFPAPAGA